MFENSKGYKFQTEKNHVKLNGIIQQYKSE